MENQKTENKINLILAKAKATAIVLGAIGTAAAAIWGAIRQPPEPGAKVTYEVLKSALDEETQLREKLENEVETLRFLIIAGCVNKKDESQIVTIDNKSKLNLQLPQNPPEKNKRKNLLPKVNEVYNW